MFNSEDGKRKMALAITHYVYRDTALENYHSKDIVMDMAFYQKIYRIVYAKLKNVKRFHPFIDEFKEIKNKDDHDALMQSVPEELRFKLIVYTNDIFYEITERCDVNWDKAELIDVQIRGNGLATFVLSGKFKECCEKNCVLVDRTMCYINKDIHNRIYSLLVNGYFN